MPEHRQRVHRPLAVDRLQHASERLHLVEQRLVVEVARIELERDPERAGDVLAAQAFHVALSGNASQRLVARVVLGRLDHQHEEVLELLQEPVHLLLAALGHVSLAVAHANVRQQLVLQALLRLLCGGRVRRRLHEEQVVVHAHVDHGERLDSSIARAAALRLDRRQAADDRVVRRHVAHFLRHALVGGAQCREAPRGKEGPPGDLAAEECDSPCAAPAADRPLAERAAVGMPEHRHPADGLARVGGDGLVAPHDVAQVLHVLVRTDGLVVEAHALVAKLLLDPFGIPAVLVDALAQLLLRHPLAAEPRARVVEVARLPRDAEVVAVAERLQLNALVGLAPAEAFALAVFGQSLPDGARVLVPDALRDEERIQLRLGSLVLAAQAHPECAFESHRIRPLAALRGDKAGDQLLGVELADRQRGATAPGNIHRRHRRAVHEHVSEQGQELGVTLRSQPAQLPSQEPLQRVRPALGVGPGAAGELHLAARECDHHERDLVQHHLLAPSHALVAGPVEGPGELFSRVVHGAVGVLSIPHAVEGLLGRRAVVVELARSLAPPVEREKQVVPLLVAQPSLRADALHVVASLL